MLRRVTLVRTDVSEELSASIIRVTIIDELWKTLTVTSNRRTLRDVPEDTILHKDRCSTFVTSLWSPSYMASMEIAISSPRAQFHGHEYVSRVQ
jgi:hypothetical protein